MPKGSNGQKRPADGVGCAVIVAEIATGEREDTAYAQPNKRKVVWQERKLVMKY